MKVYLGGSLGDWRKKVKKIRGVEVYDPFKDSCQLSLYQFTGEDLKGIAQSDVAFFYINYHCYTGSCVEAGYAHALGKEVILVFEYKGHVDAMLLGVCRKVFTDLDTALEWFKGYVERKKGV